LLGGAQSADWSSSVLAVKLWIPRGERAKGNSILLAGLYLGPIVSTPLAAWTILRFGWHMVFYGFGALGIVLGAFWWLGYRDAPARHPLITQAEADYIAAGQLPEEAMGKGILARCLRQPRFWIFGMQYFLLVLIQSFYTTWLPTYLMRARGLSLKAMGVYATLPWIAVFLAVLVAGFICDQLLKRTGSVHWARTPVAMGGFVVSALALIAASLATSMSAVISLLCLSFGAVGFVQVVVWSATQDLGRAFTGVTSGWTNLWGALSNVAGPLTLASIVKRTHSWDSGLILIGAAAACGALLWAFVHPERPLLAPAMVNASTTPTTEAASPCSKPSPTPPNRITTERDAAQMREEET
jgi:ACS family glucarate transporter-like MFS transporter